jgi:flagellar operon protein
VIINSSYSKGLNQINTNGPIRSANNLVTEFDKLLQNKIGQQDELKFSKHAQIRIKERNINLTELQKSKISDAVKRAEAKGIKDSLVVVDDIALIINIKNKTVITAANNKDLKENTFTNIDGAVFT